MESRFLTYRRIERVASLDVEASKVHRAFDLVTKDEPVRQMGTFVSASTVRSEKAVAQVVDRKCLNPDAPWNCYAILNAICFLKGTPGRTNVSNLRVPKGQQHGLHTSHIPESGKEH
jgi:hypothetical protein